MKHKGLFPPVKRQLAESLDYLLRNEAACSKVIQYSFKKNKKWGSRDRKAFAEAFYFIVRHLGAFAFELKSESLDLSGLTFPKIVKMIELYEEGFESNKASGLEFKYSASQDLLEVLEQNLSFEEKRAFLEASQATADVFLRVNHNVVSDEVCQKTLSDEGFETKFIKKACLMLVERKNVFATLSFKKGFFEVQDGASQDVAPFMELSENLRVADSCAGAGGKSLHMSAVMQNKGKITSMDIFPRRLEELKKRAKRAKAHNIEIKEIAGSKTVKRMEEKFDRVLLDVPCTGTGTYRRKPESKVFFKKSMLESLLQTQVEVLDLHSRLVKPGGLLVYATCSVLPSENRMQVDSFLKRNQKFEFVEDKTNLVGESGFDGFYMSKMKRV